MMQTKGQQRNDAIKHYDGYYEISVHILTYITPILFFNIIILIMINI
jgi:hypothetical protein